MLRCKVDESGPLAQIGCTGVGGVIANVFCNYDDGLGTSVGELC